MTPVSRLFEKASCEKLKMIVIANVDDSIVAGKADDVESLGNILLSFDPPRI